MSGGIFDAEWYTVVPTGFKPCKLTPVECPNPEQVKEECMQFFLSSLREEKAALKEQEALNERVALLQEKKALKEQEAPNDESEDDDGSEDDDESEDDGPGACLYSPPRSDSEFEPGYTSIFAQAVAKYKAEMKASKAVEEENECGGEAMEIESASTAPDDDDDSKVRKRAKTLPTDGSRAV